MLGRVGVSTHRDKSAAALAIKREYILMRHREAKSLPKSRYVHLKSDVAADDLLKELFHFVRVLHEVILVARQCAIAVQICKVRHGVDLIKRINHLAKLVNISLKAISDIGGRHIVKDPLEIPIMKIKCAAEVVYRADHKFIIVRGKK